MARSYEFNTEDIVTTRGTWSGSSTPASNTACVVTLTGTATDTCLLVKQMIFSYDNAPTGGLLTVTVGGTTVLTQAITASGIGPVDIGGIVSQRVSSTGVPATIVVTLSAGGAGVTGYLTVFSW